MKYPLTTEAKESATELVETWNENTERQLWNFIFQTGGGRILTEIMTCAYDPNSSLRIPLRIIRELATYGLIRVDGSEILLLQELRNAVENDFEVSEYFLTMNAVGTIVQGNVMMQPGSVLQSAASNTGNIAQSNELVADNLKGLLGEDFLKTQTELQDAIQALRDATDADKQSKYGKVISELGRCLQHGANTAVVVNAIGMIARFLMG